MAKLLQSRVVNRFKTCSALNFISGGLLLALFGPFMALAHDTGQLQRSIENTRDTVVKIVVYKPQSSSDPEQDELKQTTETFRKHFPEIFSLKRLRLVGSGLLLGFEGDKQGLIVSSAHLVHGARKIKVELNSGKSLTATMLGVDLNRDIALLTVPLDLNLKRGIVLPKTAPLDTLSVGQPVYTIGAPFGFSGSVTSGIVSAIREPSGILQKAAVIQTDAAVNPGNSGGPLFNYAGEVIGITTQIMSTNGGFQGVSFAVSMDSVKNSVKHIRKSVNSGSIEK